MTPAQNSGNFAESRGLPEANLSKQQKTGLAVLVFITLLIIGLWYWQLKKSIVYPLYGGISPAELAKKTAVPAAVDNSQKDTDKDGLTDVQEVDTYKTSPYLADTDGDGFEDGLEVRNGTDPNCPEGKQCSGGLAIDQTGQSNELYQGGSTTTIDLGQNSQTSLDVMNQINQATASSTGIQSTGAGLTTEQAAGLRKIFGDNPDPKVLRQKFLEVSTKDEDKQMINNMTDPQLLQVYQIMIGNQ
jgi:hypothetical protein